MSRTPFPWRLQENYDKTFRVRANPSITVANIIQTKDDAKLLAAAPDLLQAAKRAYGVLTSHHCDAFKDFISSQSWNQTLKDLKKAIDRAEEKE